MIREYEVAIAMNANAKSQVQTELQAQTGIVFAEIKDERLALTYDLRECALGRILELAQAAGIRLILNRREKFLLKLRCYRESIMREDLNNEMGWDSFVREVYVSRYRHRRHGRRDDRPQHWRQYDPLKGGVGK